MGTPIDPGISGFEYRAIAVGPTTYRPGTAAEIVRAMVAEAEDAPRARGRAAQRLSRPRRYAGYASRVSSTPSWGELITTSSPGFSQTFGSRLLPTPAGVPVEIRSPGWSVISCER